MANMTPLYIRVRFVDTETLDAALVFLRLHLNTTEEGYGHDLGMGDNWLFDADIGNLNNPEHETEYLIVQGEVRWGLNDPQAKGLVEFFRKMGAEDDMEFEYEDCANNMYGKYVYRDGKLFDHYIPDTSEIWTEYHNGEMVTEEDLENYDKTIKEVT